MVKTVSFRADEEEIIDFIKDKYFSAYVKELIKKDMNNIKNDMNNSATPISSKKEEEIHKPLRDANFDFNVEDDK